MPPPTRYLLSAADLRCIMSSLTSPKKVWWRQRGHHQKKCGVLSMSSGQPDRWSWHSLRCASRVCIILFLEPRLHKTLDAVCLLCSLVLRKRFSVIASLRFNSISSALGGVGSCGTIHKIISCSWCLYIYTHIYRHRPPIFYGWSSWMPTKNS